MFFDVEILSSLFHLCTRKTFNRQNCLLKKILKLLKHLNCTLFKNKTLQYCFKMMVYWIEILPEMLFAVICWIVRNSLLTVFELFQPSYICPPFQRTMPASEVHEKENLTQTVFGQRHTRGAKSILTLVKHNCEELFSSKLLIILV